MSAPKNIFVIGGTRYFGKRLVTRLLDQGHHVAIATRGQATDPFGSRVERFRLDRCDAAALTAAARTRPWDLVIDQVCYSSAEALAACEAFADRIPRLVHISTQSVYEKTDEQREEDFDPKAHPLRIGPRADFDYGEGKRQAEAAYFQRARFPLAAVRIPIVLGTDDYTGRLEFHLERVRAGRTIVAPNLDAATSFIDSEEAARFIEWIAFDASIQFPLNACSLGHLSLREILAVISRELGREARTAQTGPSEDMTPFVDEHSRILIPDRARRLGFKFLELRSWFPDLVAKLAQKT